ncbi:hypothetical protein ACJX0J_041537, partial [Zea mays]
VTVTRNHHFDAK